MLLPFHTLFPTNCMQVFLITTLCEYTWFSTNMDATAAMLEGSSVVMALSCQTLFLRVNLGQLSNERRDF